MAEPERIYMCGFLRKRQRGKHIKSESQRKNLKFQGRYCTLTKHAFIYSKKENVCTYKWLADSLSKSTTLLCRVRQEDHFQQKGSNLSLAQIQRHLRRELYHLLTFAFRYNSSLLLY